MVKQNCQGEQSSRDIKASHLKSHLISCYKDTTLPLQHCRMQSPFSPPNTEIKTKVNVTEVKLSVMVQQGEIGHRVKVRIGSEENGFLFCLYFIFLFLVIVAYEQKGWGEMCSERGEGKENGLTQPKWLLLGSYWIHQDERIVYKWENFKLKILKVKGGASLWTKLLKQHKY